RAPLGDVNVAAGPRETCTARDGTFRIAGLLPGDYNVYFKDNVGHASVVWMQHVDAGTTTAVYTVLERSATGVLDDLTPPADIDPDTQSVGARFDRRYVTDVPTLGRTFGSVLDGAPGAVNDG